MWGSSQLEHVDRLDFLRDARDYALLSGLTLRDKQLDNDNCVSHIPFTLFPTPFPKQLYQQCLDLQPVINELICKIANDESFIMQTLEQIAKVDSFTGNLLSLYERSLKDGIAQPISSCITRSDYMLNRGTAHGLSIRQVEVNTIASGMSGLSFGTSSLHHYVYTKYNIKLPDETLIPDNDSCNIVGDSIIEAHDAYGNRDAFILFVTEERTLNLSDQRRIEYCVTKKRADVRVVRVRFIDLPQRARLGPNKELLIDGSKEVSLVYYRYGYDPTNYNFDAAWDTRALIERSRAIKCPSINYHLSGAKKFQQVLNTAQQLERYLDPKQAQTMAKAFCQIWPLESNQFESSLQYNMIKERSAHLVLKPQREGGGHNIFGEDIRPFVETSVKPTDRSQYLLMELIDCPVEKNWLLKHDGTDSVTMLDQPHQLISELGIYGGLLSNGSKVLSSKYGGYLIRGKPYGVKEGGVAAGYAGIGNLLLIDDEIIKKNYSSFYHR